MDYQKLSCIIPIGPNHRNNQNLLQSLSSDLGSTQYILVFDNTPIEIKKELNEFSKKKSWITTIEINSRSPGGARNAGIKKCRTPWVTFFDADDLFNTRVIKEYLAQSTNQIDAMVFNYAIQDSSREILGKVLEDSSGKILDFNRSQIAMNPGIWRWVFNFEKIKNCRFYELRMGEDILFLIEFLLEVRQLHFIPNIVYKYNKENLFQLTKSKDAIQDLLSALAISLQIFSKNQKTTPNFDIRVDLTSDLLYACLKHLKWKNKSKAIMSFLGFAFESLSNLKVAMRILISRLRIKYDY